MASAKYNPVEIAQTLEVFESIMDQTAPVFRSYFESLRTAGFGHEEAILITLDFHRIFWQTIMQQPGREPY
jgi:hypothetical protein